MKTPDEIKREVLTNCLKQLYPNSKDPSTYSNITFKELFIDTIDKAFSLGVEEGKKQKIDKKYILTKEEMEEVDKLISYMSSLDLDVGSEKEHPNAEKDSLNGLTKLLFIYRKLQEGQK